MARFSIFKTPRLHKFLYKPQYWDPQKEETEAFKARISQVREKDIAGTKARISSGLKSGYGANPQLRSQLIRKSNIRIMGIIGMLVLLSFYLINRYMDTFFQWVAG